MEGLPHDARGQANRICVRYSLTEFIACRRDPPPLLGHLSPFKKSSALHPLGKRENYDQTLQHAQW